jgi:hypothetical protein
VFTTKIETGGTFWRVVFNRLIASLLFWQVIMIAVMNLKGAHIQSVALLPLPAITLLVKFICAKRFDSPIRYYKRNKSDPENNNMISNNINDKISNRFGHPVLTTELITPMVHSNVKHLLSKVYNGRIDESKVSRRGTIKSMSMIVGKNNQSFNIQTVDQNELEWDEQAYYEQKPGYYVDHSDTVSNYSGTTIMSSNNFPQMNQNHYQQRNIHPNNNSPRLPPPNSPNNPNNNVYPRQQRPRYQYDNNSSSSLLRQDSADNYSNYSDDASSLYRQQQHNYNNSAPRGGYTPPPPPPPLTPTQQYNQRGYTQNNYNQNNYNNNNYHQNNYNQNTYNPNNYNQNTYNQDNYNHQNYNNQNDRGYNNNNYRGY